MLWYTNCKQPAVKKDIKNVLISFCIQDLINQGRQKVIEATNALKSLPRESLEDTIGRLVSAARPLNCSHEHCIKLVFTCSIF